MEVKDIKMAMLVLSCDKYSDIWDDFFNLKERFWPDCKYPWFIVTESKDYQRDGVSVIKCGHDLNWSGRYRYAINQVNTPLIGVFLEDFLIKSRIDNDRVDSYVDLVYKKGISFINMNNTFGHILNVPDKQYFTDHLFHIPQHLRYGIDSAASIWDRNFLLSKLGSGDYSAWQFEVDRCNEAASEEGLGGLILCDDQRSFNVTEIPVIIQGMLYPEALAYFEKVVGYKIQSNRKIMSKSDVRRYKIKTKLSGAKHCRKILKWFGTHVLGYKFFTKD